MVTMASEDAQMALNQSATSQDNKTRRLPLILGLIGFALILGMAAMVAFYPFHYAALNAEVTKADGRFYITNNADYELRDVRLLLNSDYKLNTPVLLAHTVYNPELTEFKKDDGTFFSIDSWVNDLYITAVTPGKQTVSNIYKFNQ
jgi:hypothetical protein